MVWRTLQERETERIREIEREREAERERLRESLIRRKQEERLMMEREREREQERVRELEITCTPRGGRRRRSRQGTPPSSGAHLGSSEEGKRARQLKINLEGI